MKRGEIGLECKLLTSKAATTIRQYRGGRIGLSRSFAVLIAAVFSSICVVTGNAKAEEIFGIGPCIGKGAGLFGVYAKVRPLDVLGFEVDVGKRIYLVDDGKVEVLWPNMAAAKAQLYFMKRGKRFQVGAEAGYVYAQDMGNGGEASAIFTLRINRHLHLDAQLGLGVFPDIKNKQVDYLIDQRGGSISYYENAKYLSDIPVVAMWGIGLAVMF